MTSLIKQNKNIIAAFILFSILTVVLVFKLSVPEDFVEVTIVQGDTLSSLAQQYAGERSANEWIHEVKVLNGLQDTNIIAGEDLKLPSHSFGQTNDTRLVLAEEGD